MHLRLEFKDLFKKAFNDYLSELIEDGTINGDKKEYNIGAKTDRVDRIKNWLRENYSLDNCISKLNIARHFDRLLQEKIYDKNQVIIETDFKKEEIFGNTFNLLKDIAISLNITRIS